MYQKDWKSMHAQPIPVVILEECKGSRMSSFFVAVQMYLLSHKWWMIMGGKLRRLFSVHIIVDHAFFGLFYGQGLFGAYTKYNFFSCFIWSWEKQCNALIMVLLIIRGNYFPPLVLVVNHPTALTNDLTLA